MIFHFMITCLTQQYYLILFPKRYVNLDVSPMWRYFAMARGYQGEAGDVKALAMKIIGLVPIIINKCVPEI